jgi:Protein of unknown function (DUF1501)
MTIWMAGGGVKAGHIIGSTDEIGQRTVELVHPLRDVHFHAGRFRQLSQFGGQVIAELKA